MEDNKRAKSHNLPLFTIEDLEKAADECNFSKAIGDDGFDGGILKRDKRIRLKILSQLMERLNSNQLPDYLKQGRLVAISKRKGHAVVELSDIRPIVVRSHLSKIAERAILNKINKSSPYLLATSSY